MSTVSINSSSLGNGLQSLLMADDIQPGSEPSYQLCKSIYLFHPLGRKIAAKPVAMAQFKSRRITVPDGPEEECVEAFKKTWAEMRATDHIRCTAIQARVYGITSLIVGAKDYPTDKALNPADYGKYELYFNVLDPLNTSGSLVLNQDPNSPDFQKPVKVTAASQPYHPSRAVVLMNEEPIFIAFSSSTFGFTGRSVYQRALFPLKTFVQTMRTDDLVSLKAGLLIAKMRAPGSIVDRTMSKLAGFKRNLLKQAQTGNVLGIEPDESIETLNLMNLDGAGTFARNNALHNIASAAEMPAKILNDETFAEGFGEGTEDAKNVANYIDSIREWMQPLYEFFDHIVMRRAWTPEFYASLAQKYPELKKRGYEACFREWSNSFHAEWPELLTEPESKRVETAKVKHETLVHVAEVLMGQMDPENKVRLIQWMADNLNENKAIFSTPLELDYEALGAYEPPTAADDMPNPPREGF